MGTYLSNPLRRLFPDARITLRQGMRWVALSQVDGDSSAEEFEKQLGDAYEKITSAVKGGVLSWPGENPLEESLPPILFGIDVPPDGVELLNGSHCSELDDLHFAVSQFVEEFPPTVSLIQHLVKHGWCTRDEADRWHTARTGHAFARSPSLADTANQLRDPWTLPMTVAWIQSRSLQTVASQWDEFRELSRKWELVPQSARGREFALRASKENGWKLACLPNANLRRLAEEIEHPLMPQSQAFNELKTKLYGEKPIASGLKVAERKGAPQRLKRDTFRHTAIPNKSQQIPPTEWFNLSPGLSDEGFDDLRYWDQAQVPRYQSVSFDYAEVQRIWPAGSLEQASRDQPKETVSSAAPVSTLPLEGDGPSELEPTHHAVPGCAFRNDFEEGNELSTASRPRKVDAVVTWLTETSRNARPAGYRKELITQFQNRHPEHKPVSLRTMSEAISIMKKTLW